MDNKTLIEARNVVQRAHDYVENYGFDMNVYAGSEENVTDWMLGRTGEVVGAGSACFIGALRIAAGCEPCPGEYDPSQGDGPELPRALEAADEVARRLMDADPDLRVAAEGYVYESANEYDEDEDEDEETSVFDRDLPPGRTVEAFGFGARRIGLLANDDETDNALEVFRAVLADLNAQIDA